jgi:hypothetical protein
MDLNKVTSSINTIQNAIHWISSTPSMQGEKGDKSYSNLVDIRRRLKRKSNTLDQKPSVAIFGESQVGKSYLISSLLTKAGEKFEINAGTSKYNFIEEINPMGGGSESTSLVTRFTINEQITDASFPIEAVVLTPKDLILILCDSYYNDLKFDSSLENKSSEVDIETLVLENKSGSKVQNFLNEDDIIDVKDYLEAYCSNFQINFHNNTWKTLSRSIEYIEPTKWKLIFKMFWNGNEFYSNLFEMLINELISLNFSQRIKLPVDALLNKHGTILDVQRLKELYGANDGIQTEFKAFTTILCQDRKNEIKKSILCALITEVVFYQPQEIADEKPFLQNTDLLDFPGARSRMKLPSDEIKIEKVYELFLRGKVAYLFNSYSDSEKVNILMLCAKHEQPATRILDTLVSNWVSKIIGSDKSSREKYVKKCEVSPLFIVSTFFNTNLQYNPIHDKKGNVDSLNYRWQQRFDDSLKKELLSSEIYSWFNEWTETNPYFQNIFLLRDKEKSESLSHIFKGYLEHKIEMEEIPTPLYPNFREDLKASFLNSNFVQKHFEMPVKYWDGAATLNNDGTALIIDKLNIAAANIAAARMEKINTEIGEYFAQLTLELERHYHSSDADDNLKKAKSDAGKITAELDVKIGRDHYFFGSFMSEFMISNSDVYSLYKKVLNEIALSEHINLDIYSPIRLRVPSLSSNDTFESNLDKLKIAYNMLSNEETKSYFESQGIDLNELFFGDKNRIKSYSKLLCDNLEVFWLETFLPSKVKSLSYLSNDNFQIICDRLTSLYSKLEISKKMSEKIRHYVHINSKGDEVIELVADICTEMINKFVNSFGIDYLTDEEYNDLCIANSENDLDLILNFNHLEYTYLDNIELSDIIITLDNISDKLKEDEIPLEVQRLPHYRNFTIWTNLMKAGFVFGCDIPNYDIKSNEALGEIITEYKNSLN